jgi:Cytochrome c7 and related cytochrome c
MRRRRTCTPGPLACLAAVFSCALLGGAALRADEALDTEACLACHAGEPTPEQKAEPVGLYVSETQFRGSVHAAFGCTACHSDVTAFPHEPAPQKVACDTCHPEAASDYHASVHARAWKDRARPACLECHGNPHGILPVKDPSAPVYPLNLPRTCGRCHGDAQLAKRWGIENVYGLYIDSIHGFALTRSGLLVAASCSSCHGAHRILGPQDPESRVSRDHVPATCGACHAGIEARYAEGVHGKALHAGSSGAPVCTDCHTVHQITRVEAASWQMKTVATCGNCHEARLRTYRYTFHGQVTALGFAETARCWSCHGDHEILPASDPRSRVAPQNLVETCGQCHRGVTAGFVSFEPHPDPHDRKLNPGLYYAALFMNGLLLAVFLFFGLHSVLWLVRSWAERREGRVAPRPEPPDDSPKDDSARDDSPHDDSAKGDSPKEQEGT